MVVCHERRSWIKAWPGRGGGCSVTYAVHSSRCDGGSETYISPAITPQRSWEPSLRSARVQILKRRIRHSRQRAGSVWRAMPSSTSDPSCRPREEGPAVLCNAGGWSLGFDGSPTVPMAVAARLARGALVAPRTVDLAAETASPHRRRPAEDLSRLPQTPDTPGPRETAGEANVAAQQATVSLPAPLTRPARPS